MKTYLILICMVMACSSQEASNTIFVQISPTGLTIENKRIGKNEFASALKKIMMSKLHAGFTKESITINVKVDPKTSRGEIVDLESEMRRLNLRTVVYSATESDKQVLLRLE